MSDFNHGQLVQHTIPEDANEYARLESLFDAIRDHDEALVRQLLEKGVDPNAVLDVAAITALHVVAQEGNLTIAFLLLEAGADVNSETDDGQTPIGVARLFRHQKLYDLFQHYAKRSV